MKWVTLLDVHFNRKENLFPEEKKIYIEALRRYSPKRLDEAFYLALHECPYMPKVADVEARLPYGHENYYDPLNADFLPVKDYFMPYTATAKMHVWEDAQGLRRAAVVKLAPGELPPRIAPDPPEEQISWEECWKRIGQIGGGKSLGKRTT